MSESELAKLCAQARTVQAYRAMWPRMGYRHADSIIQRNAAWCRIWCDMAGDEENLACIEQLHQAMDAFGNLQLADDTDADEAWLWL